MRQPPFYQFVIFGLLLVLLLTLIQVGIVSIAMEKLGLSSSTIILVLFTSLIGSAINLPLFTMTGAPPKNTEPQTIHGLVFGRPIPYKGKTIIAINVGGALIPLLVSLFLFQRYDIGLMQTLIAIGIVSAICYLFSRPVHGIGIGIPILIAPLSAAITALLIAPEHSAPLAYICGTLGVLCGADLMRLHTIRDMQTPVAAIGGAGTFDGIFITGIMAVLLA